MDMMTVPTDTAQVEALLTTSLLAIGLSEVDSRRNYITDVELADFYYNRSWEIQLSITIKHPFDEDRQTLKLSAFPIFANPALLEKLRRVFAEMIGLHKWGLVDLSIEKLPEDFAPHYRKYVEPLDLL